MTIVLKCAFLIIKAKKQAELAEFYFIKIVNCQFYAFHGTSPVVLQLDKIVLKPGFLPMI